MKDARVPHRIVAAGLLAGLLLALGLCNRPISAPEDGPGERTHEGPPGESQYGPGTADGEEPSEPVSDTTDEGSRPTPSEPPPTVDLLVRIQDGMTGGPADALAVATRFGHPARSVPLVPVEGGFRLEGGIPRRGGFQLRVTPLPGFAPEYPSLRFPDVICDAARAAIVTAVVWPTFRIRVVVRDRDGLPVPDAELLAMWPGPGRGPLVTSRTGAEGEGTLDSVPLVPEGWIVVHAGRGEVGTTGVLKPVRPGEERMVRLVLWASFGGVPESAEEENAAVIESRIDDMDDLTDEPPVEEPEHRPVEVRILDEEGAPVPAVLVATGGPILAGTTQVLGLRTDASGRAVIPGVPRFTQLIIAARGGSHRRTLLEPDRDRIEVVLGGPGRRPTPNIRGIVTRVDGAVRISIGRNAGVTPGLAFDVWRLGEGQEEPMWIGTLLVEMVEETRAAGRMLPMPEDEGRPPRIGDVVCTNP